MFLAFLCGSRDQLGCWPRRLLSFRHSEREAFHYLPGSWGLEYFFPKLWKYLSFILSGTCGQERYFCFFVLVATDVTFSISALLWLIVCFFLSFFFYCYIFPAHPVSASVFLAPCCSLSYVIPCSHSCSLSHPHLSVGKIDLIKNEKGYLREMAG